PHILKPLQPLRRCRLDHKSVLLMMPVNCLKCIDLPTGIKKATLMAAPVELQRRYYCKRQAEDRAEDHAFEEVGEMHPPVVVKIFHSFRAGDDRELRLHEGEKQQIEHNGVEQVENAQHAKEVQIGVQERHRAAICRAQPC